MNTKRKFDHDEARALRAQGVEVKEIAVYCGVSISRVYQVCDPDYEAKEAKRAALTGAKWQTVCHYCGGLAVWNRYQARHPVPRCRACFVQSRTGVSVYVRDGELFCTSCQTWLPDEAFPARSDATYRRGRHSWCSPCNTANRYRTREARKVPCRACGKPRTNPKDNRGHGRDSGLCKHCYVDSVRTREPSAA